MKAVNYNDLLPKQYAWETVHSIFGGNIIWGPEKEHYLACEKARSGPVTFFLIRQGLVYMFCKGLDKKGKTVYFIYRHRVCDSNEMPIIFEISLITDKFHIKFLKNEFQINGSSILA